MTYRKPVFFCNPAVSGDFLYPSFFSAQEKEWCEFAILHLLQREWSYCHIVFRYASKMLGNIFSLWCNSDETSPVVAAVGGWQLCPYWRMAPLRTKAPLCQRRHDNSIATDLTGAHIFPVSSLTSISLSTRWMHFHGWLQALIVHWFIRNMSQSQPGLWLFIFLSKKHSTLSLCLSSVLLKCNGKQNPSLSLSDGEEKNNFKGFPTVYKPWLQEGRTLRGLRWDRPPNQSLPPEDSSHWCWWWLTDLQSSQWLSNTAMLDHLLRKFTLAEVRLAWHLRLSTINNVGKKKWG